jgi:hypothetical protein
MKKLIVLLIFFSVLSAEKIILKNGDVLTGQIIKYEDNAAVIQTSYGEIRIERDQIQKIEFENARESTPPITDKKQDEIIDVILFKGLVKLGPNECETKTYKFTQGDSIYIKVEATAHEAAKTADDALEAIVQIASIFAPTVSSIEISDLDGQILARGGGEKLVEVVYNNQNERILNVNIGNNEDNSIKTYDVTITRIPVAESLKYFDTHVKMTKRDTVKGIFEKELHLSIGESAAESFNVEDTGRMVIIVTNTESYNVLTSELGSAMTSLALSAATGLPLNLDLTEIRTGRDFGYHIQYWDPRRNEWTPFTSPTKTRFEYRIVDLHKYNFSNWAVMFDNTYSIMTSKDIRIEVYVVQSINTFE